MAYILFLILTGIWEISVGLSPTWTLLQGAKWPIPNRKMPNISAYTTREEFRGFATDINLKERTNVRKRAEDRSPQGAIFLSHSSKDDDLLTGAIHILENHGASVYIDKKDPELPPYTNKGPGVFVADGDAAAQISRKFVV